jgi:predicted GIY-YIG superfamily endonuclease
MNKYNSGKIYKIVDNTSDMIYVGSTCKSLEQRLNRHEHQFKSFMAGKKVSKLSSCQILKNGDYKIQLLENFPCDDNSDLTTKEGSYIKLYRKQKLNIVNEKVAGQTSIDTVICDCGYIYKIGNKSKHLKSYVHQKLLSKLKNQPKDIIPESIKDMNQIENKQREFILDMFELEQLEREFQKSIK